MDFWEYKSIRRRGASDRSFAEIYLLVTVEHREENKLASMANGASETPEKIKRTRNRHLIWSSLSENNTCARKSTHTGANTEYFIMYCICIFIYIYIYI